MKRLFKWLFSLIMIVVVVFAASKGVDYFTQNPGGTPTNKDGLTTLIYRSARHEDVEVECDDFSAEVILTMSIIYTVTPKKDIQNLKIRFVFADKEEQPIKTIVKEVGNVEKDVPSQVPTKLSEFSLTEISKISLWRYEVTGGTVSWF